MSRPQVEFIQYQSIKPELIGGSVKGLSQRVISQDSELGDLARILEFEPGTDTSSNGVQVHDYWEEIYIIDGSVIDLTLNKEFTKGMVASRPPGMEHGPWKSLEGCTMFEVRYYKK
ncbi:cupin domain-containing protein [Cytobacillus depressus]|uniref:cupin domain-containing protein n=1 Tax=Cytobacillus depressus TaxID=1602942 RepID=UPI0014788ABC|nr:cupin domain-containing protein [Cytobacillus depressus]